MPDQAALRLLIVDDQQGIRQLCAAIGSRLGLQCAPVESAEAALEQMRIQAADLILASLGAGASSGLELLAEVRRRWPLTEVALMSSYGSPENAVHAMHLGAYDFVVKPFRVEELQRVLERMAEKAQLIRENELLRTRLGGGMKSVPAPAAPCTDLEELERITVQRVLEQVGGDKEEAQRLLGISRATLYRKIKLYGLEMARKKTSVQAHAGTGERAAKLSQS
jgi:DNA-binding NtrC family response regulator